MRKRTLDCGLIDTAAGLHLQLSELLDLPEYYGNNLDALADCLGDIRQEVCLVLENAQALDRALGDYAQNFCGCWSTAAGKTPVFPMRYTGTGAGA